MNEKEIRAVYDDDTIRVYQAYGREIAEEALKLGTFGKHFSLDRMTWIKPSFLWMMYRCGWAEKEGQERVLQIDIKREAFDYLVTHAMLSAYQEDSGLSFDEWKLKIKRSGIRIQWDPERDIYGNPLDYRSIQIGIRGEYVRRYVQEWIVQIKDITGYVTKLHSRIKKGEDISESLPNEKTYIVQQEVRDKIGEPEEEYVIL